MRGASPSSNARHLLCNLRALFAGVLVGLGCTQDSPTVPQPEQPEPRQLQGATQAEVVVRLLKDGAAVQNISGFSAALSKVGNVYTGSFDNRSVTKNPGIIQATLLACTSSAPCDNLKYNNSIHSAPPQFHGSIHNGTFTITITNPFATCSTTFTHNNVDTPFASNGNFLDATAGDQIITFNIDTGADKCVKQTHTGAHSVPSSPLSLNVSAPDTVFVNQQFTATASAVGGFGASTRLFAWDFEADTDTLSEDFGTQQLVAGTSKTHTYTSTGTKRLQAVVRDGNNTAFQGGNYALSNTETIVVTTQPDYDAEAAGNTLPSSITYFTWVATSVTMKNTGTQTWSGTSFKLKQNNPTNFWNPLEVAFGSGSVATGQTKTFNFNLRTEEPEFCGNQSNYWRMFRTGTGLFGDSNGRTTFVSGCPGALLGLSRAILALFKAGVALAGPAPAFFLQGEVVQVLRRYDFKLPTKDVQAQQGFTIRYEAALENDWDVDFQFRIQYDPASFTVGKVVSGSRAATHQITVTEMGPGDVIVSGARVGFGGLSGQGLIMEIPFTLNQGKNSPDTLPLVELIASR